MFGLWNVRHLVSSGRRMFEMLGIRYVGCSVCEMFGIWDVGDVGCPGCDILGCEMLGIWEVRNVRYSECAIRSVGVYQNVECWFTKCDNPYSLNHFSAVFLKAAFFLNAWYFDGHQALSASYRSSRVRPATLLKKRLWQMFILVSYDALSCTRQRN